MMLREQSTHSNTSVRLPVSHISPLQAKTSTSNDGVEEDEVGTTEDTSRLMIARPTKTMRRRDGSRVSGRASYTTSSHGSSQHRRSRLPRRAKEDDSASGKTPFGQKLGKAKDIDDDQTILLPTPAFVQQASAAKCIGLVCTSLLGSISPDIDSRIRVNS